MGFYIVPKRRKYDFDGIIHITTEKTDFDGIVSITGGKQYDFDWIIHTNAKKRVGI